MLSQPDGGDLQDRVENYFLAWSNSIRRDLEALGVLNPASGNDPVFIHPADMTDEQLDAALERLGWQSRISTSRLPEMLADAEISPAGF